MRPTPTLLRDSAWLLLAAVGAILGLSPTSVAKAPARPPEAALAHYGADVSALTVFEQKGAVFRHPNGAPGDALALLRGAGMNTFRLRLFVDPVPEGIVTNDLEYTVALARRIQASGAQLLLNLHYSDTWADPAHQTKPRAWADLPFNALVARVESYTREVLERFNAEGLRPALVQLGNEITNGMLWPDGRVEFQESGDLAAWDRFAQLQLAAHRGFLQAYPDERGRPLKVLHIECTGNLPRTAWYLQAAMERQVPFDIVGFSYYPEWHGTLQELALTLVLAASTTQRPVLVAEVSYPWKGDEHWQDKPNLIFPLTRHGQRRFLEAIGRVVQSVPEGRGAGVIWWHPESVQVPGLQVWLGGSCALFDDRGRLLPAASALHSADPAAARPATP